MNQLEPKKQSTEALEQLGISIYDLSDLNRLCFTTMRCLTHPNHSETVAKPLFDFDRYASIEHVLEEQLFSKFREVGK